MAVTIATLTHPSLNGGTSLDLWCNAVVPSIKCNNTATPADNKSFGLVEVQTKSIENPKIVVQGLQLRRDIANAFNESHLLELAQLSYDGTNAAILNVTYGKPGSTTSLSLLGGTSDIKVVFESSTIPIDVSASDGGYVPLVNMTLVETL